MRKLGRTFKCAEGGRGDHRLRNGFRTVSALRALVVKGSHGSGSSELAGTIDLARLFFASLVRLELRGLEYVALGPTDKLRVRNLFTLNSLALGIVPLASYFA